MRKQTPSVGRAHFERYCRRLPDPIVPDHLKELSMNNSKYTNAPKIDPQANKTTASVDVPKTAEAAPAVTPIVNPAPAVAPVANPAPAQVAATPAEKAGQAMVNEGGNSVVLDGPRSVREPSALTGNLPDAPAPRGNGAAGPQTPVLQAKPADGAAS
jgi:hypothetical protein